MELREVVETSLALRGTRSRREKVARLATLLRRLEGPEVRPGVACLSGALPGGRIGLGPAAVREAAATPPAAEPSLALGELERRLGAVAGVSGRGSARERSRLLAELFGRCTVAEQRFLAELASGGLRQGAAEGLLVEALAEASHAPVDAVRRAVMLAGDLGAVAEALLGEGPSVLGRFATTLFRPVLPMLAQSATDVDDALARLGRAAFEPKLDGARIQVHKAGDEVRIFSRRQNDVTSALPEIVAVVRTLPARELVLDGEAIALQADGRPHPFQVTMRRFGRRLDVARRSEELPVSCFFFDCLLSGGEDLLASPGAVRRRALEEALPAALCMPCRVTDDPEQAEVFWQEALACGHEGLMAKSPEAPYEAGARGASWLKLKPAHTLDLVVLGAEWGSGRREGWLSNLHLGARDPATGSFVMVGKTFKGLSDALLTWQTQQLLAREIGRDAWGVFVEPGLVVEIAVGGVQSSPHYPAGLALRFARVRRYRPDKAPAEADTIDTLRALLPRGS